MLCPLYQTILSGECDAACNKAETGWDGGDCRGTHPVFRSCPEQWLNDGTCDAECNSATLDYDEADCTPTISLFGQRITICPESWLGDGECDEVCNQELNRFDEGDCVHGGVHGGRGGALPVPDGASAAASGGGPDQQAARAPHGSTTVDATPENVNVPSTCPSARWYPQLVQRCDGLGGQCISSADKASCDGVIKGRCSNDCA